MRKHFYLFLFAFFICNISWARSLKSKEIPEDKVRFSYDSADGEFHLNCTHFSERPETHDFTVWCGKGSPYLRTFRVHFIARIHDRSSEEKSALEVLFWVIDRDQMSSKKFSSSSTWVNFKNPSELERLRFSQGVENDYANLSVDYKP